MKERLVTDEFTGSDCSVTVTGIPAGSCGHCGHQELDENALDEIQMFLRPLLAGGVGVRMLRTPQLTIDLGHSMHPSAIDIAGPSFPVGGFGEPHRFDESGEPISRAPISTAEKARAA